MSSIPHWEDQPMLWDALYVGIKGKVAPGIVRGISVSREYDTDFKKGGGTSGETITVNGEKLARVRITLEIFNKTSHLERLRLFLLSIFPPKAAPFPHDFVHPKLAYHGLKSLFVHKLDDPDHPAPAGFLRIVLDCANFKPTPKPKPGAGATKTLATSKPGPLGGPPPVSPGEISDRADYLGSLLARGVPPGDAILLATKPMEGPPAPPGAVLPPAPPPQGPDKKPGSSIPGLFGI